MRKGFTLVELLVVLLIFGMLFAAILSVMTSSDRSWRLGRDKLIEQQEARRAMDEMSRLLRQASPRWVISGTIYDFIITDANRRVDFYNPLFDIDGNITGLEKVTFKLDPNNPQQLLKKEGTLNSVAIANEVKDINFSRNGNIVSLQLTTNKRVDFILNSQITLRNRNPALESDTIVEQPEEGEF